MNSVLFSYAFFFSFGDPVYVLQVLRCSVPSLTSETKDRKRQVESTPTPSPCFTLRLNLNSLTFFPCFSEQLYQFLSLSLS